MELLDVFVIYNPDDYKYTNWLAIPFLFKSGWWFET